MSISGWILQRMRNIYGKELFHQPTLMHNFLYSQTICLLHYYPRHVSSINMPIFRRKKLYSHSIWYLRSLQTSAQYTGWERTQVRKQYVCYIIILDMFRALTYPSSGGKNCVHTASGIFALCKRLHSTPVYCADVYRERRYQMLCEYNFFLLKMGMLMLETCRG